VQPRPPYKDFVFPLGKILPKPKDQQAWLFQLSPVIKFTSNTASLVAAEIISNLSLQFNFFFCFFYIRKI
jgi:hypothetical protein